jgi:hypothetical protein
LEGSLKGIIEKEQKDYNSWKKEREIKAANDLKLAMLNAGGSKAAKFKAQGSTLRKNGFGSSMRSTSESQFDALSSKRIRETEIRVPDPSKKLGKKKTFRMASDSKRTSIIIENSSNTGSSRTSSSRSSYDEDRVIKPVKFIENERFRSAKDQFKI